MPAARLQVLYLAFEITKYRQPASRVFGRVFQGILNIAFKSREQGIFSLSEKGYKICVREIFFIVLHYKYQKKPYI